MTEHQFDEQIRQRLGDYSSPVPENFWEKIQPKKDRDRKGFFFWLRYIILPGLLLASLTAGYLITHHRQTNPAASSPVATGDDAVAAHPIPENHPAIPTNAKAPSAASVYPTRTPLTKTTTLVSATISSRHSTHGSRRQPSNPGANYGSNSSANPNSKPGAYTPDSDRPETRHLLTPPGSQASPARETALPGLRPIPYTHGHPSAKPLPILFPVTSKKDSLIRPSRWFLDLYASPDWPMLLGEIASSQKVSFSYTVGLRVTRSFSKHFSGTLGLQYGRINTHTSSLDTVLAPVNTRLKSSSLDIPLLIGYQFRKNHLFAAINTGVIFNAYTWGDLYKQHTGLSLYLGINMVEKINERLSFFAEPYYRYRLSNMLDNTRYFQQKVNIAGLSAGIRYHFKKANRHK